MRKPERILTWEEQALLEQECGLEHDTASGQWRRDLYAKLDAALVVRNRRWDQSRAVMILFAILTLLGAMMGVVLVLLVVLVHTAWLLT